MIMKTPAHLHLLTTVTIAALLLFLQPDLTSAYERLCIDSCYVANAEQLWSDKCETRDCGACAPCNYEKPGPDDIRSVCPAFNVLANHGVIPRDGRGNNFENTARLMEEYFGLQEETANLIFYSFQGLALQLGLDFSIENFDLNQLAFNIKQTSWINNDSTKQFDHGKFEALAARATDGKITNWDLLDHQKGVITQSRCKGRWLDARYETPFGPMLGYTGDNPFMFNFANPNDFATKTMGFPASFVDAADTNPSVSEIPFMHLDIEYLRSIFEDGRFPNHYIRRDCADPAQCFGQAFGNILDPFLPAWAQSPLPMIEMYNAMYDEPAFSYISESVIAQINWAIYRNLTAHDCNTDYYNEEIDNLSVD